jgi:S-DNA-T family DNA segregation ATPase FtsK/SpoIIIE
LNTLLPAGLALSGGVYLLFSIGLAAFGISGFPPFLSIPGSFFFLCYSYPAFYIPLYLLSVGIMLAMKRLNRAFLVVLSFGVLPVMNFALIFQLLTGPPGPAARLIADTFGRRMGASLLLLTGAVELLALYVLSMHFLFGMKIPPRRNQKLLEAPKRAEELPEEDGKETEAPKELSEEPEEEDGMEEQGEWEAFDSVDRGISFPKLPELRVLARSRNLDAEDSPEDKGLLDRAGGIEGGIGTSGEAPDDEEPEEAEFVTDDGWLEEAGDFPREVRLSEAGELAGTVEEPAGTVEEPAETIEELAGTVEEPAGRENAPAAPAGQEENAGSGQLMEAKAKQDFTYHNYAVPEENLLNEYPDRHYWVIDEETRRWAEVLKNTLEEFKISAEVTGIQKGPVITMFEILPAPGVKLSKIVNLADNIALRLAASRVRIVAPIPGKHAVGIEVPNKRRALVSFREMLQSDAFQEAEMEIPVILGKDITGETQIVNLTQTPHLLIAGATGSGKSVCVNSIICSILYTRSPNEVRMVLIDPKIVELKLYNDIPHLLTPVITEARRAFQALQYLLYEMERRYSLLDALGVRDIQSYNRKIKKKRLATQHLPYIVVVVDEFADLMATSGKELESTLARLAAMSRAVGIHLVLATQRPSIDVITGLIKANIPSRIAFMVAGKFDSRIIIDSVGAEKLLGQGDMLFTSAWDPHPIRIQGAYLAEEEVEHVTDYVKTLGEPDYIDEEIFFDDEDEEWSLEMGAAGDPLMNRAVEIVTSAGKASASYLQRRLKIGYNRAARIVEEMEQRGIVGPQNGSKPREILHIPEDVRE